MLLGWHLFWRTSSKNCFSTALAPLSYHGVICFTFTFFLIITTTTVNISDVCFWFKLKRLQRTRSSHQSCFIKCDLRNFAKFTGKHQLCQSLLFNKVAGLRPLEMWVWKKKKFIFVNRVIESHPRPIKTKQRKI